MKQKSKLRKKYLGDMYYSFKEVISLDLKGADINIDILININILINSYEY